MEVSYKTPADFEVDTVQPLVDFHLKGSEELWLIQCPMNQIPEIDGKEFKVNLGKDGLLGSFEDSSGKEFDLISFASQDVGAAVIVPSGAESRIVGKISQRVSLVRYPEPGEVIENVASKAQQKLAGALTSSSNQFSTPLQSNRMRSARSAHSSRHKSGLSGGFSDMPKTSKRKHSESSSGRNNLSGSAGKPRSSKATVSGSSDRSEKSRKKRKTQE